VRRTSPSKTPQAYEFYPFHFASAIRIYLRVELQRLGWPTIIGISSTEVPINVSGQKLLGLRFLR
jgi:hypothetical protein